MKNKLLFIDIDGTLTNDHNDHQTISIENINSIRRFASLGNYVVLSSGRSKNNIKTIWDQIYDDNQYLNYVSCNNGALIYNLANDEELHRETLVEETFNRIRELLFSKGLVIKDSFTKIYYSSNSDHTKYEMELDSNIENYKYNDVTSMKMPIVVGKDFAEGEILCKELLNSFDDIEATPAQVGEYCFVEITKKGSNKGFSVTYLSNLLNIDIEDCIHIGDSMNDIKAFERTGLSIAMSNSKDVVKEKADLITKSVEEYGVSYAIETMLLKEK